VFLPEFFFGAEKIGHLDQNLTDLRVVLLEKREEFMPDPVPKVLRGLVGWVGQVSDLLGFEVILDLLSPGFNQRSNVNSIPHRRNAGQAAGPRPSQEPHHQRFGLIISRMT
jgi:hypothetical protein